MIGFKGARTQILKGQVGQKYINWIVHKTIKTSKLVNWLKQILLQLWK